MTNFQNHEKDERHENGKFRVLSCISWFISFTWILRVQRFHRGSMLTRIGSSVKPFHSPHSPFTSLTGSEAMKLSRITFLSVVIVFFAFSVLKADEPTVLIDEGFDAKTIPDKWQPGGRKGSFTIVDGSLRAVAQPDDSHGPSIGVPISGHDLTIEFDVRFAKANGYFLFLIDGASQYGGQAHLLRFAATPRLIQLMQDRGDLASKKAQKKERDANGGKRIPPTPEQLADPKFYRIEQLARQNAKPSDGKWHHVRIELRGNNVTARLDDGPMLSGKGTVLDEPKSRIVFLVGQSGDIRIDKVRVTNQKQRR
jgi:hypothetical protein